MRNVAYAALSARRTAAGSEAEAAAVAALVYGRDKHVINVFVSPAAKPGPGSSVQDFNMVGWRMGGMGYQAVSDLNMPELTSFARLMQAPSL